MLIPNCVAVLQQKNIELPSVSLCSFVFDEASNDGGSCGVKTFGLESLRPNFFAPAYDEVLLDAFTPMPL